jgi:hypothetical protein
MELVLTIVREHWLKPNRKACIDKRNRRIMGQIIMSEELKMAPDSFWSSIIDILIDDDIPLLSSVHMFYVWDIYDDIVLYFKNRFNLEPEYQWVRRQQYYIYEKINDNR